MVSTGFEKNIDRIPLNLDVERVTLSRMIAWADMNVGRIEQILLITQAVKSCSAKMRSMCELETPVGGLSYLDLANSIYGTALAFAHRRVVHENQIPRAKISFTTSDIAFSDSWLSLNDFHTLEAFSMSARKKIIVGNQRPSEILDEVKDNLTEHSASVLETRFMQAVANVVFTMRSMILSKIKFEEFNAGSKVGSIEEAATTT
jgi:hypothetical protein